MSNEETIRLLRQFLFSALAGAILALPAGTRLADWLLPIDAGRDNFLQILACALAQYVVVSICMVIGGVAGLFLKYRHELRRI